MPLAAGTRLGPYDVLGLIGAGGMGEVYRARDTRLDRTVAIKVLPAAFSSDPARRARFEREARVVSGLNHPHICTLHDVGDADGRAFLVMEHLAGETLEDRLKRGPLPLAQALEVGAQIAEALAAAHKHGIVHRDLKPGNVMLVKGGAGVAPLVKLLDFGLARLLPVTPAEGSISTTLSSPSAVVGTVPYMAPEQLEGKAVDARADLWALGCVLYEMVTGARAFEGTSAASVTAAILEHEPPPLSERQPLAPVGLERLVGRCLAKDPEQRWESARDVTEALRWLAPGSGPSSGVVPPVAVRPWWTRARWGLGLVAAGLLGVALGRFARPHAFAPPAPAAPAVAHLDVVLPPDAPFWVDTTVFFKPSLAISPDGTLIAYTCARGDTTQICLRRLERSEVLPMPGTERGRNPAFSPDGRRLLFCVAERATYCRRGAPLKVLSIADARVDSVGAVPEEAGAPLTINWASDAQVLVGSPGGIWSIAIGGGTATRLVECDSKRGEIYAMWPAWLPGERRLLYSFRTVTPERVIDEIRLLDVANGERRVVLNDARSAQYLPTGHLLFHRGFLAELHVAAFDPATLSVGTSVPLWEKVRPFEAWSMLALSSSGTLLYVPVEAERVLTWVDRQARTVPALPTKGPWQSPRLSPDGRRAAVEVAREPMRPAIAVVDLDRGAVTDIVNEGWYPAWTPDAARVTYVPGTDDRVAWVSSDGSGTAETLHHAFGSSTGSWSPDGQAYMFSGLLGQVPAASATSVLWTGTSVLWTLVRGDAGWTPREFHRYGWGPRFSPDGRWVAYTSNESGDAEVYVRAYPNADRLTKASMGGGENAVWSRDGRELFYRNDDRFYAVTVTLTPTFSLGVPRLLFRGPYRHEGAYGQSFDVSRDGQRFLVVQVGEEERAPRRLHLVQNWYEEVKARVPAVN